MSEIDELVETLEDVQNDLDDLIVRGLRAAGPAALARLRARREELQRIGAEHLALQLQQLVTAAENDDRGASAALFRAQVSVRLFERVLSLQVATSALGAMVEGENGRGESGESDESEV